uniref:Uncharacterized protein n=1 Tax=Triticum urartu TaxID=4572 RepID=A0A8R7PL44_TRIUA
MTAPGGPSPPTTRSASPGAISPPSSTPRPALTEKGPWPTSPPSPGGFSPSPTSLSSEACSPTRSSALCCGDLHPDALLNKEQQIRADKKAYHAHLKNYHSESGTPA